MNGWGVGFIAEFAAYQVPGEKNEDRWLAILSHERIEHGSMSNVASFGVFDGHNGAEAAEICTTNLSISTVGLYSTLLRSAHTLFQHESFRSKRRGGNSYSSDASLAPKMEIECFFADEVEEIELSRGDLLAGNDSFCMPVNTNVNDSRANAASTNHVRAGGVDDAAESDVWKTNLGTDTGSDSDELSDHIPDRDASVLEKIESDLALEGVATVVLSKSQPQPQSISSAAVREHIFMTADTPSEDDSTIGSMSGSELVGKMGAACCDQLIEAEKRDALLCEAIRKSCIILDREIRSKSEAGTTVSMLVLEKLANGSIRATCANVGDSRCVMFLSHIERKALSKAVSNPDIEYSEEPANLQPVDFQDEDSISCDFMPPCDPVLGARDALRTVGGAFTKQVRQTITATAHLLSEDHKLNSLRERERIQMGMPPRWYPLSLDSSPRYLPVRLQTRLHTNAAGKFQTTFEVRHNRLLRRPTRNAVSRQHAARQFVRKVRNSIELEMMAKMQKKAASMSFYNILKSSEEATTVSRAPSPPPFDISAAPYVTIVAPHPMRSPFLHGTVDYVPPRPKSPSPSPTNSAIATASKDVNVNRTIQQVDTIEVGQSALDLDETTHGANERERERRLQRVSTAESREVASSTATSTATSTVNFDEFVTVPSSQDDALSGATEKWAGYLRQSETPTSVEDISPKPTTELTRRLTRSYSFIGRRQTPDGRSAGPEALFGRHNYSITMTRTIGDRYGPRSCVPLPEISSFTVKPGVYARFVLASDGFWDVVGVESVRRKVLLKQISSCRELSRALAEKAYRRRARAAMRMDDITVLVVDVNPMQATLISSRSGEETRVVNIGANGTVVDDAGCVPTACSLS